MSDLPVLTTKAQMKTWSRGERGAGRRVGFVPTMGALHEGHLSLIRSARSECGAVAVSVFVNPTQFGPSEDLDRYPRTLHKDCAAASAAGAGAVFAPGVDEMYPAGAETFVMQEMLTSVLCGASRPTHFRGVLTVVAKLLNVVAPDTMYMGQKDFQQTVVVRRMVADLDFPVEVRVCPTVREADGLAMSSRNRYLSSEERRKALCLIDALRACRARFVAGERDGAALRDAMVSRIAQEPAARLDYAEVVDPQRLVSANPAGPDSVAVVAVFIGGTRLIDNLRLGDST
jgi:pantoate--beta-alanine ligase